MIALSAKSSRCVSSANDNQDEKKQKEDQGLS